LEEKIQIHSQSHYFPFRKRGVKNLEIIEMVVFT